MITGSIVALVTPMHDDGSVDWDSLERLLDMHIAGRHCRDWRRGHHRRECHPQRSRAL